MKRLSITYLVFLTLLSCKSGEGSYKKIDLNVFSIIVPKDWCFKNPKNQEDSFVGQITGPLLMLSFDYSLMGYANHLLPTEQEYLTSEEWLHECYFCKSGLTYRNTPDRKAKKTIHLPTSKQKAKFPKANFIADLTYKDSTVYVPIEIPNEIKIQNIEIDTTDKFIIKTIWPKVTGSGSTGIYIYSRSSKLNFQMNGDNLSAENQNFALQAFKTIHLSNK